RPPSSAILLPYTPLFRSQIDPQQASRIYTEIGIEDQIHSAVRNAIRKGVRDGMVQYSINDISKRTQIARTMEALVDSALVTQPRSEEHTSELQSPDHLVC